MEKKNELKADFIEVTVKGSLKTEHDFQSADGRLGLLKMNGLITEGTFQGVDGLSIHFKKTSLLKAQYELDQEGVKLGSAKPAKALRKALSLELEGKSFSLVPGKLLTRTWNLLNSEGSPICELKPRGVLKRGAVIQILSPVELKLLVFAYCLVTKRWQEESSAS